MQDINKKAQIISISLTATEKEFLEYMELSPTALMKQKISELMTSSMAQRKEIAHLRENIAKLQDRISSFNIYLDEKNLLEDYNKRFGLI